VKLDRRQFLGALGLAAATGCTGSASGSRTQHTLDRSSDTALWKSVRAAYPLSDRRIYLNTAGLGPCPARVLDLVETKRRELQTEAETGRDSFEHARPIVAAFLGAEPDEIAFTRNATESNSIVAAGLDLRAGDEVLLDSHAHPGGSFPWLALQKRLGVSVRVFTPSPRSPEENLERIHAALGPRTRVVQLSHVTAPTGILLPAREVAALCRERGIWLHLDSAQAVGMLPVDVRALGCDSLAVSGHKWLGAPHETGALFVRRAKIEALAPVHAGAYSDAGYSLPERIDWAPTARRFEYGTRDGAAVLGLAEACRFQDDIGRESIAAHGTALAAAAAESLSAVPGVEVSSSRHPALRTAITTFRIRDLPASRVFGYLLEKHALRCRPVTEEGMQHVRVSPHVFNDREHVDRLVAAVADASRSLA
jgi:selenocysteine lyase/cysteine desulfurase